MPRIRNWLLICCLSYLPSDFSEDITSRPVTTDLSPGQRLACQLGFGAYCCSGTLRPRFDEDLVGLLVGTLRPPELPSKAPLAPHIQGLPGTGRKHHVIDSVDRVPVVADSSVMFSCGFPS